MKKSLAFSIFAQKYWWLLLGLVLLLLIPVVIFCVVFCGELRDVSAWASMIAGIATYLGSAFLGVLVFYNSWVQTEISNSLDDIDLIINIALDFDENEHRFVPFEYNKINFVDYQHYPKTFNGKFTNSKLKYFCFEIKNNNYYTPVYVEIEGIYVLNEKGIFEKCPEVDRFMDTIPNVILDYQNNRTVYYGIHETYIEHNNHLRNGCINCAFVFKVLNTKGAVKYYVQDYGIGRDILGDPRILNEEQYNKNIESYGVPVDVTAFNKQFLRKNYNNL